MANQHLSMVYKNLWQIGINSEIELIWYRFQNYLYFSQYKTFFGDDIWAALNDQANFDSVLPKDATVNAIAASWITKDRLPVVNVIRNYEDNSVNITQVFILLICLLPLVFFLITESILTWKTTRSSWSR